MQYTTKWVYIIQNVYKFVDKTTWEDKVCVQAIRQSKFPVSWLTSFFYTEKEFNDLYEDYIAPEEFNYWLTWIYMETEKTVIEDMKRLSNTKIDI